MRGVILYLRYAAASVRTQMLYPASFLIQMVGQSLNTIVTFAAVWLLFQRFGHLKGWTVGEIALFYGIANLSLAIAEMVGRGFDVFGTTFIKTGDFDRLLTRPRATALQVLGYELRLTRLGRMLQGAVVLAIGLSLARIEWSLADTVMLLAALAGGAALFSGALILQATLSFWTTETLEVGHVATYGGVEASQYPLDIYSRWFSAVLIGGVPVAAVTYFPILAILGRSDSLGAPDWILPIAPAAGFIFLGVALWAWGFGVRRYRSTGS